MASIMDEWYFSRKAITDYNEVCVPYPILSYLP